MVVYQLNGASIGCQGDGLFHKNLADYIAIW